MEIPNRILLLVDDPAQLQASISKARMLQEAAGAGELLADLTIAQVIYDAAIDWRECPAEERARLQAEKLTAAKTALLHGLPTSLANEVTVDCLTLWGESSWQTALEFAQNGSFDLIVKAEDAAANAQPHLHTPADWQLLRHSAIPVLMIDQQPWQSPLTIAVAIDGYDPALDALNTALLEAAKTVSDMLGAQLHVIASGPALQPSLIEAGAEPGAVGNQAPAHLSLREGLEQLLATAKLNPAQLHVLSGEPSRAIAQQSEQLQASLVVIGTHARKGATGAIFGNTAEKLLGKSPVDLLVIAA